jgi:hypothetical protein
MIDYATSGVVAGICGLAFAGIKWDLNSIKKKLDKMVTKENCEVSRKSCGELVVERRMNSDSRNEDVCRKITECKNRIEKVEAIVHGLELKVSNL